jgi:hypothetical protein
MLGLYRLNVSIRRRLKMSHRQFVTDANRKAFASANHRVNSTVSNHTREYRVDGYMTAKVRSSSKRSRVLRNTIRQEQKRRF